MTYTQWCDFTFTLLFDGAIVYFILSFIPVFIREYKKNQEAYRYNLKCSADEHSSKSAYFSRKKD